MNFLPGCSQHRPANPGVHWTVVSGAIVRCCHLGGLFVLYFIVTSAHGLLENIRQDFQGWVS